MNVLDLFSGIGGFSLGLERAGFTTKYFCEIEPYCRRVLAKHWPDVPCLSDVRTLRGTDVEDIDLICGGFPCQDISLAGKGAGLSGERSGLWFEYARVIEEVRPSYVLIENVSALRSRGLDQVLGSLAALGCDAEWHCIPASAVGAPHRRDRVWIVAHPTRIQSGRQESRAIRERIREGRESIAVADAEREGSQGQRGEHELRSFGSQIEISRNSWWESEPNVGRVAYGVPARVDRLRGLGNAIVPQIAEILGRAIIAHAQSVRLSKEVFS